MSKADLELGITILTQREEFEKSLAMLRIWKRHRNPNLSLLQAHAGKQRDRLDELMAELRRKRERAAISDTSEQHPTALAVIKADSALLSAPFQIVTDSMIERGCPPPRRGTTADRREESPMIIVDSVRYYRPCNPPGWDSVAAFTDAKAIDPSTVVRVETYRGPQATVLFGADAANGVIVVTTKR